MARPDSLQMGRSLVLLFADESWAAAGPGSSRQSLRQRTHELCRDLFGGKGALWLVPVADPVQSARDRERRYLGIARQNGPVIDTFLDEGAQSAVDLFLVFTDFGKCVA